VTPAAERAERGQAGRERGQAGGDPGAAGGERGQAGGERDRDAVGRPKNARPRDGLGRPLARDATGEPVMPDDLRLEPAEAVLLAQRLIDEGRPFHAHEVLEAAWKSGPDDERDLWQGLAQIAVGLTHARRGNSRGAVSLLRRGSAAVDGYRARAARRPADEPAQRVPANLDAAGVARAAAELADRIAAAGLAPLADSDLRLRMTPRPGRSA
jgi:uncharacterized protein